VRDRLPRRRRGYYVLCPKGLPLRSSIPKTPVRQQVRDRLPRRRRGYYVLCPKGLPLRHAFFSVAAKVPKGPNMTWCARPLTIQKPLAQASLSDRASQRLPSDNKCEIGSRAGGADIMSCARRASLSATRFSAWRQACPRHAIYCFVLEGHPSAFLLLLLDIYIRGRDQSNPEVTNAIYEVPETVI